jgi:hypothetical protein
MSRISVILVLLLVLLLVSLIASPAHATLVEVSLPGLHGTYPLDAQTNTRTVTFQLPDPPGAVYDAWFAVSGVTQVGQIECDGNLYAWPTMLFATMEDDSPVKVWYAQELMPEVAGPYSWMARFDATMNATWSFLGDGTASITLLGAPGEYIHICSPASAPPTLTVTSAVLIIDAEFPIRTEPTTWGRVKALYRD